MFINIIKKILAVIRNNWIILGIGLLIILLIIIPEKIKNYTPSYLKTQENEQTNKGQEAIPGSKEGQNNTETGGKTSGSGENTEVPITPLQLEKISEGDILYSKLVTKIRQTYPFITKIPIDKPDYFIVFDYDVVRFRIIFKFKENERSKEVVEALAAKAALDIKNIGGEKYQYYTVFQE